jgi:hypothetical protein
MIIKVNIFHLVFVIVYINLFKHRITFNDNRYEDEFFNLDCTNFKFQILLIILCISIENKGNIVKTNSKDSKSLLQLCFFS